MPGKPKIPKVPKPPDFVPKFSFPKFDLKKGLLQNLIHAKLEAMRIKNPGAEVTPEIEKECELTRDAIVQFMISNIWTISELKASLEVEELKTTAPLGVKSTTPPGVPVVAGSPPGAGTTTGPGIGIANEPLQMRKSGAPHGGTMIATGHAYVGRKDPTPNSDTRNEKNDFTRVVLHKEKIKKETL